ncbi:MAG: recombinase family protein [Actinobacteria bacterium]|nr:recombinase family protein [Actinomycetota bacterium]
MCARGLVCCALSSDGIRWSTGVSVFEVRVRLRLGHLDPWNVRLSHVLCNREDYGWGMRIRKMLERKMSLEEIAENLNDKGVRTPHGSGKWSAGHVRKAFVS